VDSVLHRLARRPFCWNRCGRIVSRGQVRGVRKVDSKKAKRIIWLVLIGALLVAGSFRAWEWLEPWRVIGQERFDPYVQR